MPLKLRFLCILDEFVKIDTELQGELNIIHAKFKEEVHQHLQDCRHTVDGLNAHQMKLRGTMEKQSMTYTRF